MTRKGHHVLGAVTGLGVAHAAGWPLPMALAAAGAALSAAGGRCSPDADQYGSWDRLWRFRVPLLGRELSFGWAAAWRVFAWLVTLAPWWRRERSRHGDPCQHRGITHWPGVPALWSLALVPVTAALPWWASGLAWSLVAGWSSHLLGDAVFGRRVHGQDSRGIPLAPWWGHWSLTGRRVREFGPSWLRLTWKGLSSDGWAERAVTVVLVPVGVWQAAAIAGLPVPGL